MKSILVLMAMALQTVAASAAPSALAGKPDRKVIEVDGKKATTVLHSENYEYVCRSTVKEGSGSYEADIWIDKDFEKDSGFRVAVSFPDIATIVDEDGDRLIGVELPVVSGAVARCRETCILITVVGDINGAAENYDFEMRDVNGVLKLTATNQKSKEVEIEGTCRSNQVP